LKPIKAYIYKNKSFFQSEIHFPPEEDLDEETSVRLAQQIGYSTTATLIVGLEFGEFEVFEAVQSSPVSVKYPFFSYLSPTLRLFEIVLFESVIDLLDFLNHYAPAFTLLRENCLAQVKWGQLRG